MKVTSSLLLFLAMTLQSAMSEIVYTPDANLDLGFHQYKTFGHKHRAHAGIDTKFNDNFNLNLGLNALYFSIYNDQDKKKNLNKQNLEIYLAENYLTYAKNNSQLKIGYQIVSWGESFAFNYADIINPKDQRETFYFDYTNSRLPSFMINYRYFFEDGSMEFIYSPEIRYSKTMPLELVLKEEIPGIELKTKSKDKEKFFDKNDFGLKLSKTISTTDISLFHFNYIDKNPYYSVAAFNGTALTLAENHNRITSTGLSLAKTINDQYVFRTDLVYHQDKEINSLQNLNLTHSKSNVREFSASLDTPTFYNVSGLLLFAQSSLEESIPNALRNKHLYYMVAKVTYDFKEDRKLDLSLTKEFPNDASAVLAVFNYPYNDSLEIRLGAEYYWGEKDSQLNRLKDISSVFIGFKNYFNL